MGYFARATIAYATNRKREIVKYKLQRNKNYFRGHIAKHIGKRAGLSSKCFATRRSKKSRHGEANQERRASRIFCCNRGSAQIAVII